MLESIKRSEKGGISWIGHRIAKLIELVELYSLKDGLRIFYKLYKKNKSYTIKASFLTAPLYLRDNFSDKAIFQQVFTEQQYLPHSFTFPTVQTILDGGANVGIATVLFANKFPDAQILAIEPEASNFQMLLANTQAYSKVQCIQGAIWDADENISIANPESLAASYMVEKNDETATTVLQGNTIATLQKKVGWNSIDLVKLDIEGAEREVFKGNTQWLSNVKLLIIELHDHYKLGCSKALFQALAPYEYECLFHHENIFITFHHTASHR